MAYGGLQGSVRLAYSTTGFLLCMEQRRILDLFGEYLRDEGISAAISGRLWMVLGLMGIGCGVFWGTLSDRLGRRAGFQFSSLGIG